MRDQRRDDARFGAPECAAVELRDALPALEHGRLPEGERRRVERHVEECAACAAELALLRDVRGLVGAGAPAVDLDRIALAVSAATVRPRTGARPADVVSLTALRERRAARARPAWATRLTSAGGLRAAAALLLVALGGAVIASRADRRGASLPALDTVAVAPVRATDAAPSAAATAPAPRPELAVREAATRAPAHALGERFDDLSDDELSRVLVALENDDAALPALEPAVQAVEYRGGGE